MNAPGPTLAGLAGMGERRSAKAVVVLGVEVCQQLS
jgi:hypothetical protein